MVVVAVAGPTAGFTPSPCHLPPLPSRPLILRPCLPPLSFVPCNLSPYPLPFRIPLTYPAFTAAWFMCLCHIPTMIASVGLMLA